MRLVYAPCLLLGLVQPTLAQLTLLGHGSGTVPIQSAIGDLLARFDGSNQPSKPGKKQTSKIELRHTLDKWFPIETKLKLSDSATSRELDIPLTSPICLLGDDSTSRDWLQRNHQRLVELNARCILIKANNKASATEITRLAKPLSLAALPFGSIAKQHGITEYPVLLIGKRLGDVK